MVGRGRKTTQELTIAGSDVFRIPRPAPPAELEPHEAEEWRAIVGANPPERFPRDTHPLLIAYCGMKGQLDQVNSRIKQICEEVPMDDDAYLKWTRHRVVTTRELANLATKLRLAPSTYEDKRLKRPETVDQPWRED